ncbi:MAG TPA: hypothetical protein VN641_13205 [Urbifossiella sp.]|nr:hypothetical protein [Urbifossiella sp.]
MSAPANVLMLCDDLIFYSRVMGTARALGQTAAQFRSAKALAEAARQHPPAIAILDLQHEGLDLPALLAELRQLASPPRVVGFGSHVEAETLRAARDAGCDQVLPRSKFVKELEEILKS